MLQKILTTICIFSFTGVLYAYGIVTPVPRDYTVSVTPQGYVSCMTTKTGAYKGIWSGAHRVCRYNIPGSEFWMAGYWQCHRYKVQQGVCTNWKWILPHWENIKTAQLEPDRVIQSGWHVR